RAALTELGPTFVKIGQILSTRPDLVSIELIRQLEHLQEDVPAFSFAQARTIVETELGHPLEDLFEVFDVEPVAAPSIVQLDRAGAGPRVHQSVTARRVLTMSYEEGIRVTETARLRLYGLDPKRIARRGADLMMVQIFDFGYFHADPHPGNIFVEPGHRVLFL